MTPVGGSAPTFVLGRDRLVSLTIEEVQASWIEVETRAIAGSDSSPRLSACDALATLGEGPLIKPVRIVILHLDHPNGASIAHEVHE